MPRPARRGELRVATRSSRAAMGPWPRGPHNEPVGGVGPFTSRPGRRTRTRTGASPPSRGAGECRRRAPARAALVYTGPGPGLARVCTCGRAVRFPYGRPTGRGDRVISLRPDGMKRESGKAIFPQLCVICLHTGPGRRGRLGGTLNLFRFVYDPERRSSIERARALP